MLKIKSIMLKIMLSKSDHDQGLIFIIAFNSQYGSICYAGIIWGIINSGKELDNNHMNSM